jgi:tRNA(Arg) A34 adenosine deaminase TadA
MDDAAFMQLALAAAQQAIAAGQMPVGAVVVRDGQLLLSAHNNVWADTDPSAHAEMFAIRRAARQLQSVALTGCTVYVTLEPCPMCLAACHWARVERIVYGARIADSIAAGFSELTIPAAELVKLGRSPVRVDFLPDLQAECAGLFAAWRAAGQSKVY